jgi:D-3-phosphoglycerate dehydrogenase
LEDFLAESDVVAIHALLNEETRHLIDRRAIAHMKPDAILVNTARGGIVEPEAVLERLESGRLGGYASDVFVPEDPNAHPVNKQLLAFENVIVSSHCAFLSSEAETSIRQRAAALIVELLTTERRPSLGRVA